MEDSYKTVVGVAEGLFKEKGSKFISRMYHVVDEEEVRQIQGDVRKEFHDARHHCFAYRIDPELDISKSSDDGEPSGTAGKPILNQIYSYELFNVLIIVIRYFGGTKLGVSGLIQAYKTAAREALENAKIVTRYLTQEIELYFEYPLMNSVMRLIKEENLKILNQGFDTHCVIKIEVKLGDLERVLFRCDKIRGLDIKELENS